MTTMASQITCVSDVFMLLFAKEQINENIKAPCHWPSCVEFTGHQWIPAQKASNSEMFPLDDAIMKSRFVCRWLAHNDAITMVCLSV